MHCIHGTKEIVWYSIGYRVRLRVNVLDCTLNTESRNGCPNLDVVLALPRWKFTVRVLYSTDFSFIFLPLSSSPSVCSLGLLFLESLEVLSRVEKDSLVSWTNIVVCTV